VSDQPEKQIKARSAYLRQLRLGSGVTRQQLAKQLDISEDLIFHWEKEAAGFRLAVGASLRLALALELSWRNYIELLEAMGHRLEDSAIQEETYKKALNLPPDVRQMWARHFVHPLQLDNLAIEANNPPPNTEETQEQLRKLQGAVDSLASSVDELKNTAKDPSVQAGIVDVSAAINQVLEISDNLTAPISFPTREQMRVRLVPLSDVDRISEYHSEENTWYSVGGVLLGVVLGVVVNIVTGGVMTPFAWAVIVSATLLGGLAGWTAWRYGQKAHRLRDSYLANYKEFTK
jgi:DNA-binding XRE family transcriptional regulator